MKYIFFSLFFSVQITHAQSDSWVSISIEPNNVVNCLYTFDNKLIAGGFFNKLGTQKINLIGAWDGNIWSSFGSGLYGGFNPYVAELLEFKNELYAVGNFDSAGVVASKDIAKWDGTKWHSMGEGSNRGVFTIALFRNEIYVGGNFDTIGGIATRFIAKWKDTGWVQVGDQFQGNSIAGLYVYNDELYALGSFDSIGGILVDGIARWNGAAWNKVSSGFNSENRTFIEWKGKLICGSNSKIVGSDLFQQTQQWNGQNWSIFSSQNMFPISKFLVFNDKLYCSGGSSPVPSHLSMVARWDNISQKWTQVGTGIDNATIALCEFQGQIYCGGYFDKSNGSSFNYIARLANNSEIQALKIERFKVYPNPANREIHFEFSYLDETKMEIYNSVGLTIREIAIKSPSGNYILDIRNFLPGVYMVKLINGNNVHIRQIVIE
jgi:hypothetical protein